MLSISSQNLAGQRLHCVWSAGVAAVWCLTFAAGCTSAPDLETSRQFQAAEEQFASASEPADFVKAASMYQEILDDGFRSGVVLYNQGNAWMQAGRPGRAIAAYRQARYYLPRDPYLQANLNQALPRESDQAGKPLLDYLFFWQQMISYYEKGVLCTVLLGLALVLTLASQLGWQPTLTRRAGFVTLAVTLLVGLSFARDWVKIEQTRHGVVIAETMARKGGADSYDPAFNQALAEGTEFVVQAEQNDWLHIQIPDSGEGWIPRRAAVTW
ncbi:MAG: hypothetical protein RIK87_18625 [Fuerstiella sp.]